MSSWGFCWKCGSEVASQIFRSSSCEKCGADLRVCKSCRWFDISSARECREEAADLVIDKEKANFCDYFKPNLLLKGSDLALKKLEQAKKQAEALFKPKN